VQVEELPEVRLGAVRDDALCEQQAAVVAERATTVTEDRLCAVVVPVVEDARQDVRVGGRKRVREEVGADDLARLRRTR
jgi:hypothetical protein